MERENGYYWVLLGDKWIIAEHEDGHWKLTGQYMHFFDGSFTQILERKLLPPVHEKPNSQE